jgi:hypothetical protein
MTDSTTEIDQVERDKLMSKAYTTAQSDLRKTHQDEFNALYQKRCAELGIQWEPRKSKQDQALDQMLTLLTEYPALAEKLAAKLAAGSGESPG